MVSDLANEVISAERGSEFRLKPQAITHLVKVADDHQLSDKFE
jgi:hypothetical protein